MDRNPALMTTNDSLNITEECFSQAQLIVPVMENMEHVPVAVMVLFTVPATVIILLTIFGNLLVLFFKARVGRTNTTLLVWNLGLTDFLVGVIVLPLGAVHLITRKWVFGRLLCRIWVAADVTFCTCSVVTICVISVDRYLAVTRPLRYKSVVTKFKVIMVMIMIWSFSSTILLTTVRWESSPNCADEYICFAGNEIRYLAHSVVFAFFLPASVTLTLYWRIYRLARNRQRALDRGFLVILGHNMNFLTNTLSQNTALRVHFGKNNGMVEQQRRVLRTHERIAKTLGVVSCSFLFCWLPFFSLYLANYQCSGCIPTLFIDISSWLGYCNSMLNPIIYSFTVKEFKRSALRAILPVWRTFYGCVPTCLPKPPDHVARMSRSGNRAKPRSHGVPSHGKRRPTSTAGVLHKRQPTERRLTEPMVFAVTKPNASRRGRSADNAHKIHDKSHADTEEPHAPHFTITSDAKTEESSQGGIIERLLTGSSDSLSDDGPIRMPYHPRKTPSPSGSKLNNGDARTAPTGKWKRGRGWFGSKKWKRISGREADSDPAPGSRRFPEHEKLMQNGSTTGSWCRPTGSSSQQPSPSLTTNGEITTLGCNLSLREPSSTSSMEPVRVYCVTSEANV